MGKYKSLNEKNRKKKIRSLFLLRKFFCDGTAVFLVLFDHTNPSKFNCPLEVDPFMH